MKENVSLLLEIEDQQMLSFEMKTHLGDRPMVPIKQQRR